MLTMTQLLSAAPIKKKITKELKSECKQLIAQGIHPFLKVVLVGNDPASIIYTNSKKKYAERIGAKCEIVELDEQISESEFLKMIDNINGDQLVHGCIIQLPLPRHLTHLNVGKLIRVDKDVDGFHPENLYAIMSNQVSARNFISCTPKGIMTLLKENGIDVEGKRVAIIGRSMIVGKPLACLMSNANATVTLCHSKTKNITNITRESDIIVSAAGIANLVDESFLSLNKNQVIIDVGMNYNSSGDLCGDVNFERVQNLVAAISPVPGGVGPMTIISLAQNLLQASKNRLFL